MLFSRSSSRNGSLINTRRGGNFSSPLDGTWAQQREIGQRNEIFLITRETNPDQGDKKRGGEMGLAREKWRGPLREKGVESWKNRGVGEKEITIHPSKIWLPTGRNLQVALMQK